MSHFLSIFLLIFFSISSIGFSANSTKFKYKPTDSLKEQKKAISDKGVVVTAHPLASKAGIQMLKHGGNAFDALLATSFVISVVRPQSTGIGGGGFLLYYEPKFKSTKVLDFRERAPLKANKNMYLNADGSEKSFLYNGHIIPKPSQNGHLAAGVPGLVAGLIEIHQEKGSLPLSQVMAPAIAIADKGFPVYKNLEKHLSYVVDTLKLFPESRKIFMPNGKALKVGDKLIQKDLAKTLKLIARHGKEAFYDGPIAKKIVAEMENGKGIISSKDLKDYKTKKQKPVIGKFKGYKIVSMPPPSSGGIHIVQMLNMLENAKLNLKNHLLPQNMHIVTEVMRRAFADRAEYLGDPEFYKVPIKGLTSRKYAKNLYNTIDIKQATSSKKLNPGNPTSYESDSTTHISIVDRWGNAISSTQTINSLFGSKVVVKGTGIILNNEMDDFSIKPGVPNIFGLVGSEANAIAAKKTMLSSMSPTLVFNPNNNLEMILGSPGGPRIITATFQTILNYIAYKMPLEDAVHAARYHHQWLPDQIRLESNAKIPEQTLQELKKMGHTYVYKDYPIGDVQAIGRYENSWIGVSDLRSDGTVATIHPTQETPPVKITYQRVPDQGIQPQIITKKHKVHMIYFAGDRKDGSLIYRVKKSGTNIWSNKKYITPKGYTFPNTGMIAAAQFTVDDQEGIHVTWFDGKRKQFLYSQLKKQSKSFTKPSQVIKKYIDGIESSPSITSLGKEVHIIWHAGNLSDEGKRGVYQIVSNDLGITWGQEIMISDPEDGACGCCGIKSFTHKEQIHSLYRRAKNKTSRDIVLLSQTNSQKLNQSETIHPWETQSCPVSTAAFDATHGLIAWETKGQIYARTLKGRDKIWKASGKTKKRRKNPAILQGSKFTLVAWGDGMSWASGGTLNWELLDSSFHPITFSHTKHKIPFFSGVAISEESGGFVIHY